MRPQRQAYRRFGCAFGRLLTFVAMYLACGRAGKPSLFRRDVACLELAPQLPAHYYPGG
jgi:hypothetical protein